MSTAGAFLFGVATGGSAVSFDEWLKTHRNDDEDPALDRVDKDIAILRMRAGAEVTEAFSARVATLNDEISPARRRLLADSLLLDLAEAVKRNETRCAQREELSGLRSELVLLGGQRVRQFCERIDSELASSGTAACPELIEQAIEMITAERRERAVASRRLAVLQGLASVGYEVVEGMATAWVRDGKVVLRRAATPGYGVEIAGTAATDRIQVRAVRFGPGDAAREEEAEAIWCGEFERLRRLVASSGGEINIEKAIPAGETPLKAVEGYDDYLEQVEHEASAQFHRLKV